MDPRLSEEARAYALFAQTNFPREATPTVEGMREHDRAIHKRVNEKFAGTFTGKFEERQIKVDEKTEIPITIYTPVGATKDKILIYFHGGGWFFGSRQTHQTILSILADETKSVCISVEYRLAPEHKFPTWLDDTCEVTRQVLANKAAFGGDENTKVGVAGDSAGGAIAASVAHLVKGLSFQILIYAALDLSYETPSCKEFTKPEHVLTPDLMAWSNANAYRTEKDKNDPRASVMRHETFDGVPPCQFIVAELDPLHDDSFNYRNKLEDAGIKTRLQVVKGVPHAFFTLPGIFKEACAQGVQTAKEFMESI